VNKTMTRSLYVLAVATFIFALSSVLEAVVLPNSNSGSPTSTVDGSMDRPTPSKTLDETQGTTSGTTSNMNTSSDEKSDQNNIDRQKSMTSKSQPDSDQNTKSSAPDLASPTLYPPRR